MLSRARTWQQCREHASRARLRLRSSWALLRRHLPGKLRQAGTADGPSRGRCRAMWAEIERSRNRATVDLVAKTVIGALTLRDRRLHWVAVWKGSDIGLTLRDRTASSGEARQNTGGRRPAHEAEQKWRKMNTPVKTLEPRPAIGTRRQDRSTAAPLRDVEVEGRGEPSQGDEVLLASRACSKDVPTSAIRSSGAARGARRAS